jgi:hypothetical protein
MFQRQSFLHSVQDWLIYSLRFLLLLPHKVNGANAVLVDTQVFREQKAIRVKREIRENKDKQESLVNGDSKVSRELLAFRVKRETKAIRVVVVRMERKEFKATRVIRATKVLVEIRVCKEFRARRVTRELRVKRETRATREIAVSKDFVVLVVREVKQE